jgi:nitrate/nitrite transporter NarK
MKQRQVRPLANLILVLFVAAGSTWLLRPTGGIVCDQLAPLTVLTMLAVVLLALSLRQLASTQQRAILWITILLAAVCITVDVRYVARYHGLCSGLRQAPVSAPPQ